MIPLFNKYLHIPKILSPLAALINYYSKMITLVVCACILLLMMVARLTDNRYCITLDLDCSWVIDGQAKLLQGAISGRDYYFTYGPLGQVLVSVGALIRPNVPVIDRLPLLLIGFHVGTIALLIAILTCIPFANWRTSLITLVVLFAVIDFNLSTRPLITVLSTVLIARALSAPPGRFRDLLCIIVGIIAFTGQLVTFEVGPLILLVALSLIVIAFFLQLRGLFPDDSPTLNLRHTVRSILLLIVPYLIGNLLVSLFFKLSSHDNRGLFDYQYYNFELANAYSHTMITPWVLDTTFAVVIIMVLIYSIFSIIVRLKNMSSGQRYLYIGLGILSILQLKSALIRNDLGHVVLAVTPLIFLFLLVTYEVQAQKSFRVIGVFLTLALIAAPPWAGEWIKSTISAAASPNNIRERLHMARSFTISPSEIVSNELVRSLDPHSYILNFPYENIIAVALERENVSPIIQAYSANNTVLQQYYVKQAAIVKKKTEVIYCIDSPQIDGVEHITRTPLIFEYLLRNFELKNSSLYMGRCAILRPRSVPFEPPTEVKSFQQTIDGGVQRATLKGPPTSCTLLRLKMTINYPPTTLFGRATPIEVQVIRGSERLPAQRVIPIEMGSEFETYLYLGPSSTSYQLFNPSGKSDYTEQVDALEIHNVSFGPLDVHARDVALNEIDCINMNSGNVVATQPRRDAIFGPILPSRELQQEFVAESDNLAGVYIQMATYKRTNNSKLIFSLHAADMPKTSIASMTIDAATLQDNEFFLFHFPPQKSQGKRYIVTIISPEATEDKAVTAWIQTGNPYPNGKLLINTKPFDGDLTFKLFYAKAN